MLKTIGYLSRLWNQSIAHGDFRSSTFSLTKLLDSRKEKCDLRDVKTLHTTHIWFSHEKLRKRPGTKDALHYQEATITKKRSLDLFPDETLPEQIFNGVMYKHLPIVNIRVTPNNTILSLTDFRGVLQVIWSCGMEGFKNVKKGTNVASQSAAITFSHKVLDKGFKTVRVRIRGLGPGRVSSFKGLVLGGLDIVSVTDNTRVSENPPRPKKLRRV